MHDLLTKAVEAGARAIAPKLDNLEAHGLYRREVEAALRAALPGILEAVVGAGGSGPATCDMLSTFVCEALDAKEATQRALVAQILEGK